MPRNPNPDLLGSSFTIQNHRALKSQQAEAYPIKSFNNMIRSSSTPVIGSLLSIFPDSPNRDHDQNTSKISFSHGVNNLSLNPMSCLKNPLSYASGFKEFNQESGCSGRRTFRRSCSDGNLEALTCSSYDMDDFQKSLAPTKSSCKNLRSVLRSEPSLSIYNSNCDKTHDSKNPKQEFNNEEQLERTVTIGEVIKGLDDGGDFCFGKKTMGSIEEAEDEQEILDGFQAFGLENDDQPASPPLYLATGLGIDSTGFDTTVDSVDLSLVSSDERSNLDEYYQRMINEYPCHPLLLRNYAQHLLSKGDLFGAEEYYSLAALANPEDGEVVVQYAKLTWQLYHDKERAMNYFKHAAEVSPQDSHVLAAYASFLWEIDDNGEQDEPHQDNLQKEYMNELENSTSKEKKASSINEPDSSAVESRQCSSVEEYYRKIIEENPNHPLCLGNYAQFLYKSKGDHQGAEEYYSRAILADPYNGEILGQYANLLWEIYHDSARATSYFRQAVQASPDNSHVLAAYASFLWENEEDEEDKVNDGDQRQLALSNGTMNAANA